MYMNRVSCERQAVNLQKYLTNGFYNYLVRSTKFDLYSNHSNAVIYLMKRYSKHKYYLNSTFVLLVLSKRNDDDAEDNLKGFSCQHRCIKSI